MLDADTEEVLIAGPGVSPGYLNDAALDAVKFIERDGVRFVRSGDRGRWIDGPDGQGPVLELVGRLTDDRQVKVRGFRVQLDGVEATLLQLPIVRQAAVLYHLDALHAFATLNVSIESFEVCGGRVAVEVYCRQKLPVYEIPATLTVLDALPMTANGKVDAAALRTLAAASKEGFVAGAGADHQFRSSLERIVASTFEAVLTLPPGTARPLSNFFELGGTSLTAVQMITLLHSQLADPAINPTGVARFDLDADQRKV